MLRMWIRNEAHKLRGYSTEYEYENIDNVQMSIQSLIIQSQAEGPV